MVIVSLTTWWRRINNIPVVLDSIFSQTMPPDKIVLNLSEDETIPEQVNQYISDHNVVVNRVPDTKVYKKILPTIMQYKESVIICIDDDWIYPSDMIADFMEVHKKHPNMPVTGNYIVYHHLNCHCGCASLVKYDYFGDYLDIIDDEVMKNCPSDDILFTYFAAKTGHYYTRTKGTYFLNMKPVGADEPYSERFSHPEDKTWNYLCNRFGRFRYFFDLKLLWLILIRRLKAIL